MLFRLPQEAPASEQGTEFLRARAAGYSYVGGAGVFAKWLVVLE